MKLSFLFTVKYPLVRFGWRGQSRDSIGTVLCVDDDGILRVGFPGASRGWRADPAEIERVEEYKVGNWVRIRPSLTVAVHGMESITPGSVGIVYSIRPDSSLLLGLCYLSNPWLCEPEEVEHVDPFKVIFLNYLPFNIIYGLFVSCFPHIFFELSTSEYDPFVVVRLQSFTTKSPFGTAVAFIRTSIYILLVIYIFLRVITSKFHYFSVNSN